MDLRVLVDANVLYSRTLRDWLLLLDGDDDEGALTVCWTEDILAEVVYRLRRRHPTLSGSAITRIRDLIADSLARGRIARYEIPDGFIGTDPDDQHVHAAAVAGQVRALVTADRGFHAPEVRAAVPYRVWTPDDLLLRVYLQNRHRVEDVTMQQLLFWRARSGSADLGGALRRAGCWRFATLVDSDLRRLGIGPARPP